MVIPCFGSTSQCGDSRSPASVRMNRKWPVFLAISALRLNAQVTATTPRELAESGYRVRATNERIRLDARFSEPVWATTDSIVDFRQREPLEGAPATERTVVKIIRDAERLYVAIRAYDPDVRSIRSAQLRRDADLSSDDNVTLLVDSYRDRRGAFFFRTNPNGAMWDAQLTGLDNVNENWNGIWEVVTRRDSVSWSAEFAIPLRTLRFNPGNDVIGLNVRRVIRSKNEEDLWRSWGRAQGLDNLLNIGTPQRTQLFYSRRIGLDSTGAPVPISVGARVYGKAGAWGVGLLDARTGGGESANDIVVRLGRDLLERSTIVAMLVDRSRP